jgi:hypothetical protein
MACLLKVTAIEKECHMEVFMGAFFIALVLTALIAFGFEKERDLFSLGMFFMLIFFPIWAMAIWIPATGPVWQGIPWVEFIFIAIIMALFILALSPPSNRSNSENIEFVTKNNESTIRTYSAVYWVFLGLMVVVIILGFNRPGL